VRDLSSNPSGQSVNSIGERTNYISTTTTTNKTKQAKHTPNKIKKTQNQKYTK
jgi:hypothetical protein